MLDAEITDRLKFGLVLSCLFGTRQCCNVHLCYGLELSRSLAKRKQSFAITESLFCILYVLSLQALSELGDLSHALKSCSPCPSLLVRSLFI